MQNKKLIDSYMKFAKVARPFLHIENKAHYEESLQLIEKLLDHASDEEDDPLNGLIEILSHAVEIYEASIPQFSEFKKQSNHLPADVAMLRFLMEQHNLSGSDFPEIGSRSLISKILSGERNLTKKHIELLAKRFKINPSLFF